MRKNIGLVLVVTLICAMLLSACGKEVVATTDPVPTEPAVTTTISADEAVTEAPKPEVKTEVAEPTEEMKESEPTKEVKPVEPTVEPEPTEKPTETPVEAVEPTEEPEPITFKYNQALAPYVGANEELPSPKVDVNSYIDNGYFDFIKFQEDMGCEHWYYDNELLSFVGCNINGWNVEITSDPWYGEIRMIGVGKFNSNLSSMRFDWIIYSSADTVKVAINESPGQKEEKFGLTSIQMLPYILEWCRENSYSPDVHPGVFNNWERW